MRRAKPEMKAVVHMPKDPAQCKALNQRLAEIHAQTVMNRLQKLHIPLEQKEELLDGIITSGKKKDGMVRE